MKFQLPELPYAKDALDPNISASTLDIHYEKHHRGYMDKLKKALADKPEADKDLDELVRTSEGYVFNQAAQVWNHTFYWRSMAPDGGGKPTGEVLRAIEGAFGSHEGFKQTFAEAANGEFGSGWAWLARDKNGALQILSTSDARNPMQRGLEPLLACDVWEHAYYLDYRNERDRYVEKFIDNLINWNFVQENLKTG